MSATKSFYDQELEASEAAKAAEGAKVSKDTVFVYDSLTHLMEDVNTYGLNLELTKAATNEHSVATFKYTINGLVPHLLLKDVPLAIFVKEEYKKENDPKTTAYISRISESLSPEDFLLMKNYTKEMKRVYRIAAATMKEYKSKSVHSSLKYEDHVRSVSDDGRMVTEIIDLPDKQTSFTFFVFLDPHDTGTKGTKFIDLRDEVAAYRDINTTEEELARIKANSKDKPALRFKHVSDIVGWFGDKMMVEMYLNVGRLVIVKSNICTMRFSASEILVKERIIFKTYNQQKINSALDREISKRNIGTHLNIFNKRTVNAIKLLTTNTVKTRTIKAA